MAPEINSTYFDIKRQLNMILLNSTFADRINPYAKISEIITFPEDIDIIKSHIKRIFKCDIPGNIADMTPDELIQQIYSLNKDFVIKDSDIVFKQKIKSETQPVPHTNNTQWSRGAIFTYIFTTLSKTMERNVKVTERISDLMIELQMTGIDSQKLNCTLKELENFFDIKIDQSMKVYNVANAAELSFIAQGRAPAHNNSDEQKDPLWRAIITATSLKYLKSILQHDLNIHVSIFTLSNIKSYEEFKALIQSKQK